MIIGAVQFFPVSADIQQQFQSAVRAESDPVSHGIEFQYLSCRGRIDLSILWHDADTASSGISGLFRGLFHALTDLSVHRAAYSDTFPHQLPGCCIFSRFPVFPCLFCFFHFPPDTPARPEADQQSQHSRCHDVIHLHVSTFLFP